MAKKQPKRWVQSPSRRKSFPTVDTVVKAATEAKVRRILDEVLRPRFVHPPPDEPRFNYVTDVTLKWHGPSLFLAKVYACPGPDALSPSFEARFVRLRHSGGGRFDLAFLRHTGEWVELYQGRTVDDCLDSIRDDPWFQG